MLNIHTIDASGKKLGRVASEVAVLLMGKNLADFNRNEIPNVKVNIVNSSKAEISEKKKNEKIYNSYSGYPGGLKQRTMKNVIGRAGFSKLFEDAVYGMLPCNKLRDKMMKNLIITE